MSQLEQRLVELRFIDGVEKVEHVPFPTGDQFWVRFDHPFDMQKLEQKARNRGCRVIKFGGLLAKLPRGPSEVLWDGVTHVIVKEISQWSKFISRLGFEPDGIGKIAIDLHNSNQIFMAMNEVGIQLLYDYLGVKYVPPPPKPSVAPAKLAPKPSTPTVEPASKAQNPPGETKPSTSAQTPPAEKVTA